MDSDDTSSICLVLLEGIPAEIAEDARLQLGPLGSDFRIVYRPSAAYAGNELYLPTAMWLFIAAGFFNGFLQEAGKDAYVALKSAAVSMWNHAKALNLTKVSSKGKLPSEPQFSLAFSIVGDLSGSSRFKFILRTEVASEEAKAGISCFFDLLIELVNGRISDSEAISLLTYRPVGGTVLVEYDPVSRKIVPVDPLAK